jgi:hypothetical protein
VPPRSCSQLIIYPEQKLVVAVLVNSDYSFIRAMSRYAEPFLEHETASHR